MSLQGQHFQSWQKYKVTGAELNTMFNRIISEVESAHEIVKLKIENKDNEIRMLKEQIELLKNQDLKIEYKEKIVYKKR